MRLRDFLALDDEQFRALFRGSPIKRIKRRGFLRNVCVALGNVGTRDDLPALRNAALDDEPLVAEHAAWAIERIEQRFRSNVLRTAILNPSAPSRRMDLRTRPGHPHERKPFAKV